jgi:hypothetical protein
MIKKYLIYNLDNQRYVAGKDYSENIKLEASVALAKEFDSKEEAEKFMENLNGYQQYYTVIEVFVA